MAGSAVRPRRPRVVDSLIPVLTPFIGRSEVQADLDDALAASRWVSIVGPPGSGKTLLVRHAVARRTDTAWVSAARLEGVDAILMACLEALQVEPALGDSTSAALTRSLDDRETLLVVDGLGSDVSGLGDVFEEVVESTTNSRIATTAFAAAARPSERVVRVGPLALPRPGEPVSGPAYELFQARLQAAGATGIDLDAHEKDVRRLLQATGGLPLLIEQIAVQIALVGVPNVVPTASLSEAVHASYELLDADHQRCFRRMAQMRSPVSLDVLSAITGVERMEAAGLAAGLARRSLLDVQPDGRFDMLAPIRRHGTFITASTDDAEQTRDGLLRWAEGVVPTDVNLGAADARWLGDLPVMRLAIESACADPATRPRGYSLANGIFSTLYTAMRAREAVEILEGVLVSGDGPSDIGAQVARRAGIAASEVRGTYEGLWLLDRAELYADVAPDPVMEHARNASIRAEMHLDAGDLGQAETEARRAIELGVADAYLTRQAQRTLVDVYVSRGDFVAAEEMADTVMTGAKPEERWMALSARVLCGRIALEQGRLAEAHAAARAAYVESRALAEDRIALLAENLLRQIDDTMLPSPHDRTSLPWAVRLGVLLQDARALALEGEMERAAGLAADVVVLADSGRLGRDGVDGRLLLAEIFVGTDDLDQALSTYLSVLDRAARCPLPLRVADALDGLAVIAARRGHVGARSLAATARSLRSPRRAVAWGGSVTHSIDPGRATAPVGWVVDGQLTDTALAAVESVFAEGPDTSTSAVGLLTRSERAVAEKVAAGKTNRQIAEELFISPRTVDAHLSHIYRKLEIATRSRLAVLMTSAS